jgi:ADP-ribose pyrophosphatase YjhB (NUDIX family)
VRWRIHRGLLRLFGCLPRGGRLWLTKRVAPSFTVGAITVIEDGGRVLLIRQSYRPRWGLPGGLLRRGEGPEAAAHREAAEEVGVRIELVGDPVVVVDPQPRRVDVVYRARLVDGSGPGAPSSPEIVEARWFAWDELPELQDEAKSALRALLRRSV